MKLSGLDYFYVLNSRFANSGNGSGIDMVGCHYGIIMDNEFEALGSNFIQIKGGSEKIVVHKNFMSGVDNRGINMGGCTGSSYFRPSIADGVNYEARHIRVSANIILKTDSGVAYVGCDECVAVNNLIYKPKSWAFRILQETVMAQGVEFIKSQEGVFSNNIVVFENEINALVNVGPDTAPTTFILENNLWYCSDNSAFDYQSDKASLPVVEKDGIQQKNPLFLNESMLDFHISINSPATNSGLPGKINSDFDGNCADNDIGPYQSNGFQWFDFDKDDDVDGLNLSHFIMKSFPYDELNLFCMSYGRILMGGK